MSNQTRLEIKGNLRERPFAELLAEITEAKLSGSFRLENGNEKSIVYLDQGEVVFAVSNMREHRLFSVLLEECVVTEEQLRVAPNIGNDIELGTKLIEEAIISQEILSDQKKKQIVRILDYCIRWNDGEWIFSSLARIKDGIQYSVDSLSILLELARSLESSDIAERFKSDDESFGIKPDSPFHINLQSHEAFVLSRFETEFMTLGEIDSLSGLPADVTRQVLYGLWLGGFLFRRNWDSVLNDSKISEMLEAKLQLVIETKSAEPAVPLVQPQPSPDISEADKSAFNEELKEINEEQALLDYLDRIETSKTLYEVIGVLVEAETANIKKAYFAQAKKYHPDLFHSNPEYHLRVQAAFTNLAHAYETLKAKDSRELYDFKMRKALLETKEREDSGMSVKEASINKQLEKAAENFEWGMSLLEEDEHSESIAFFARAVHFDSETAKYHAYYGKALSFIKKNLHQAESELQAALRIEPENSEFRFMLAELFVQIGLKKRAEGELSRLISTNPSNKEALALLDSLQTK